VKVHDLIRQSEWTGVMASNLGLSESVLRNSMSEHELNGNNEFNQDESKPRWGPQHVGAQKLASQYTAGLFCYHHWLLTATCTCIVIVIQYTNIYARYYTLCVTFLN